MYDTRRTGLPQGFFGYLGLLLVRLRWVVVVFWAVVALAVYVYLPPLDDATTARVSDLVPESAPASRAESETATALSGPVEAPAVLIFSNPNGFSPRDLRVVDAGLAYLNGPEAPYRLERAVPLAVEGPVPSPDSGLIGRKALPVLLFFERGISPTGVGTGVGQIRAAFDELSEGLKVEVTGPQPIQDDNEAAIVDNLWLVTLATAVAIYLIVALTYRSPLTPLVPLVGVGLSIFLTLRILARVATETGTELPSQVEPIITVLLFGVGTDYTLFLLSRTRQALAGGADRLEAARLGIERVGGVLLSSAMVLIAAFGLLVFSTLGIYQALGPGLGIALSVVFLVTLTLVPALLSILGRTAFGRLEVQRPASTAASSPILRRPGLTAGVLVAVLFVLATGAFGLRVGFDQVENLPDDAPSVEGYALLAEGFPQGVLAPINVFVEGEGVAYRDEELRRLKSRLLGYGGFATAIGEQDKAMLPGVEFEAEDGSAVRFLLVFYGAPYSAEALDQAQRLQENLPQILAASGLEDATGSVGGQTALAAAARDTSNDDLLRLAPLVFAVSFLVLALLLRTPVAPLYLLFATILSFAATIGVSTVLFQNVLGQGGVVYYVPFSLFLLLIALGSDYNIFIMAAIREEVRERPLREAVPLALKKTGPTISAAGFALAASFALLTLIPLQDFFQVGVAVSLGILLDAFVIRTMLVPAFVLLVGRIGFWPAKVR